MALQLYQVCLIHISFIIYYYMSIITSMYSLFSYCIFCIHISSTVIIFFLFTLFLLLPNLKMFRRYYKANTQLFTLYSFLIIYNNIQSARLQTFVRDVFQIYLLTFSQINKKIYTVYCDMNNQNFLYSSYHFTNII